MRGIIDEVLEVLRKEYEDDEEEEAEPESAE